MIDPPPFSVVQGAARVKRFCFYFARKLHTAEIVRLFGGGLLYPGFLAQAAL